MINCTAAEEILHGNKVTLTHASAYIWNKKTVLVSFGQQMYGQINLQIVARILFE